MPEESKPEMFVKLTDLPRKKSERFISVYANHTEASPGFYEVRLVFSQIAADLPSKPEIEEHAGIAITWEHAARLRDLLVRLIEAYEKQHGPVRVQDDTPALEEPIEPPSDPYK